MELSDIVGQVFGRLTVVEHSRTERYANPKYQRIDYFYLCRCQCGETAVVKRNDLRANHTKSCGCLKLRRGGKHHSWTGHGDISGRMWASIRSKAKSRGLTFEITIEDAWKQFQAQSGCCCLTGWPLEMKGTKARNWNDKTASLDRVDNTKGYTPDNIQWLHKDVNWMKGSFTTDRFIVLCQAITEHRGEQR